MKKNNENVIKAKQSTNGINYKQGRKCLCVISEKHKRDGYSVCGLPELGTGDKYYEVFQPVTNRWGISAAYHTLDEAKERAEFFILSLFFGKVQIKYM